MNVGPKVLALLWCVLAGALASAQTSAYVFGRIVDPSEAVVPGANITVVNQDSGFRRLTETGPDGTFAVGSLLAGLYKVMVRKDGFVGMVRFDVRLARPSPDGADFKLTVGAVQEP